MVSAGKRQTLVKLPSVLEKRRKPAKLRELENQSVISPDPATLWLRLHAHDDAVVHQVPSQKAKVVGSSGCCPASLGLGGALGP